MHLSGVIPRPRSTIFIRVHLWLRLSHTLLSALLPSRAKKFRKTKPIAPLFATPAAENKPKQTQFFGFPLETAWGLGERESREAGAGCRRDPYTPASTFSAAAMVASISSSLWAAERNAASYCEHGR